MRRNNPLERPPAARPVHSRSPVRIGLALLLLLALLPFASGCRGLSADLAAPTVDRLEAPVRQVAQLETGRTIYTSSNKCARCHRPKTIANYTPTEWTERILPKMAPKAKLSDLERQYLTAYLLAAAQSRSSVISSR